MARRGVNGLGEDCVNTEARMDELAGESFRLGGDARLGLALYGSTDHWDFTLYVFRSPLGLFELSLGRPLPFAPHIWSQSRQMPEQVQRRVGTAMFYALKSAHRKRYEPAQSSQVHNVFFISLPFLFSVNHALILPRVVSQGYV